ncbi:MAG TPA: hypothetical protein VFC18_06590 [Burkholderiales bacterium]|nr:hypothetical protein [Burkholderiales bacterium]
MRAPAALLAFAALSAWAQTCLVCGEVRSIREIGGAVPVEPRSGQVGVSSGLDTPMVVGSVAQFRFGGGREEGWTFGAAGTPEMQARLAETTFEIHVAMDVGETRTVRRHDANRFHVGQRVALRAGELEPM